MKENAFDELKRAIAESYIPAMEGIENAAEKILAELNKLFNAICADIYDEIAEIVEEIKRQYLVEKPKDWKVPTKQEIRPLYLDKRRKVHRCRNNC